MTSKNRPVQVSDRAPDFSLPDQDGQERRLSDLTKDRCVVLYFYPKDNTPGCTAESCSFRDAYEDFKEMGAEIVGISSDPVESHKNFALKHRLPFILLSDSSGLVRKIYGVPATFGLLPGRVTYVIDQNGVVRHIFNSQINATKHIPEALRALSEIKKNGQSPDS